MLASWGCASAPPPSVDSNAAIRCELIGDVASAQVRVGTGTTAFLDAVIHHVPTHLRATDAALAVDVRAPLAFSGIATQLDVRTAVDASIDGLALAHPVRLTAKHGLPGDRVRLRVPGRYGLDLALPCDALALGVAEAHLDAPIAADARWYDVDAEVAVRHEGSDAILGWIGGDRANAAVLAAFEPGIDGAADVVRILAPGLVLTGRVDRARFTERDAPAVAPSIPSSGVVDVSEGERVVIDVPIGAHVFASPTDPEPWTTVAAPLVLVSTARDGERFGVVSIEDRAACAADPCQRSDLRWVIARRRSDSSDPTATLGAWFDASEVRVRGH